MTAPSRTPDPATTLLDELETLREENRQLRALLCPALTFPARLELSPFEHRLLAALVAIGTRHASHERLVAAVEECFRGGEPEYEAIKVYVSRLRRKLRPFGVEIENLARIGWRIAPGGIGILEAMIAAEAKAR